MASSVTQFPKSILESLMTLELRCVDKNHKGERWQLNLDDGKAVFRDPDGRIAGEFSPEEAIERFQMPSLSESIKYFGVRLGEQVWRFDVSKSDLNLNRSRCSSIGRSLQVVPRL
jgi:hypothetical protein